MARIAPDNATKSNMNYWLLCAKLLDYCLNFLHIFAILVSPKTDIGSIRLPNVYEKAVCQKIVAGNVIMATKLARGILNNETKNTGSLQEGTSLNSSLYNIRKKCIGRCNTAV